MFKQMLMKESPGDVSERITHWQHVTVIWADLHFPLIGLGSLLSLGAFARPGPPGLRAKVQKPDT